MLVAGRRGLGTHEKRDGGDRWNRLDLKPTDTEWVDEAALNAHGRIHAFVMLETSASMTTDGRQNWNRSNLPLKRREKVTAKAFSADGKTGLVAGNRGSIFMTTDGGQSWDSVERAAAG